MKPKLVKGIFTELVEATCKTLAPWGYSHRPERAERIGGYMAEYWIKDEDWKSNVVQLMADFPCGGLALGIVHANVMVVLPYPIGNEPECYLDVTGLSYAARERSCSYRMPSTLFHRIFPNRFKNKIIRDIIGAQAWFDRYGTPQKCLALLEEGETINGPSPGHRDTAMNYLRDVIARESKRAEP